jgi:hypothetical protein
VFERVVQPKALCDGKEGRVSSTQEGMPRKPYCDGEGGKASLQERIDEPNSPGLVSAMRSVETVRQATLHFVVPEVRIAEAAVTAQTMRFIVWISGKNFAVDMNAFDLVR